MAVLSVVLSAAHQPPAALLKLKDKEKLAARMWINNREKAYRLGASWRAKNSKLFWKIVGTDSTGKALETYEEKISSIEALKDDAYSALEDTYARIGNSMKTIEEIFEEDAELPKKQRMSAETRATYKEKMKALQQKSKDAKAKHDERISKLEAREAKLVFPALSPKVQKMYDAYLQACEERKAALDVLKKASDKGFTDTMDLRKKIANMEKALPQPERKRHAMKQKL